MSNGFNIKPRDQMLTLKQHNKNIKYCNTTMPLKNALCHTTSKWFNQYSHYYHEVCCTKAPTFLKPHQASSSFALKKKKMKLNFFFLQMFSLWEIQMLWLLDGYHFNITNFVFHEGYATCEYHTIMLRFIFQRWIYLVIFSENIMPWSIYLPIIDTNEQGS